MSNLKLDLSWGTEGRVNLREYLGFSNRGVLSSPDHARFALKISLSDGDAKTHNQQKIFEKIHQIVERLRQEDRLILYGVGTIASVIAPLLIDKISYFVDGNSALYGKEFLGKPIHSPEVLISETGHTVFVTPINRKKVIGKRLSDCNLPVYFIDDAL